LQRERYCNLYKKDLDPDRGRQFDDLKLGQESDRVGLSCSLSLAEDVAQAGYPILIWGTEGVGSARAVRRQPAG